MKIKHVTLTIKNKSEALKHFAETLARARKKEKLEKHEGISFESIEALRKVLTEKRLELLHIIRKEEPESIYELAKQADRDLKSVNSDVEILADVGLVSLEEVYEERKKIRPFVEFDKLQVEIAI